MSRPKPQLGRPQRLALQACPTCGKVLDAASGVGHNRRPKPGDVTICAFGCGAPLTWTDAGALRVLTAAELRALPPDVRAPLARVGAAARAVRRAGAPG